MDKETFEKKYRLARYLIYESHRQTEAIPILLELINQKPNNLRIKYDLGVAYMDIEEFNEAQEYFDCILNSGKIEESFLLCMIADNLISLGDFERAASLLEKAQSIDAEYEEIYLLKSLTTNSIDEKISLLNKAIELDPKYTSAFLELGEVYRANKDFELAKSTLEKIAKLMPEDGRIYLLLSYVYEDMGGKEQAIKSLQIAGDLLIKNYVTEMGLNTDLVLQVAEYLIYLKQDPSEILKVAEKYEPDRGQTYWLQSKLEKDPLKVISLLKKATKLSPKAYQAFYDLGMFYKEIGEDEKAIKILREAELIKKV